MHLASVNRFHRHATHSGFVCVEPVCRPSAPPSRLQLEGILATVAHFCFPARNVAERIRSCSHQLSHWPPPIGVSLVIWWLPTRCATRHAVGAILVLFSEQRRTNHHQRFLIGLGRLSAYPGLLARLLLRRSGRSRGAGSRRFFVPTSLRRAMSK